MFLCVWVRVCVCMWVSNGRRAGGDVVEGYMGKNEYESEARVRKGEDGGGEEVNEGVKEKETRGGRGRTVGRGSKKERRRVEGGK